MADLLSLGADVEWPDHEAATIVREHFARTSGYGRLGEVAEWTASVRGSSEPIGRIRLLLLGAEPAHHPARPRPSAAPAPVEAAHLVETADSLGVTIVPVTPAADVRTAFDAGVQLVDDEVESGTELLILAMPGLGADIAVAASVLTNTEPVKVLSRGAAATVPEAWMDLAIAVRDQRRECMPLRDRPDELLDGIGSARLATAAAICLRAAVRRTPLVLDGPAATVGALVAYESAPRAVRWWCAADLGDEPVHALALTRLGQQAVLGLGTSLGDGLAGLLAVSVLHAAVRLGAV